jgi:magnesium-transporting ATPase (P-type)
MENNTYHHQKIDKVLSLLKTSKKGLSKEESRQRLQKYGLNEIPEKKNKHPIFLFLKQFKSIFIYILIVAALISYFIGHRIDTYIILVVILINSLIGFIQEYKAEKSVKALKKNLTFKTQVLRDGRQLELLTSNLVPGDIVILEEGDRTQWRCFQIYNYVYVGIKEV